MFLTDLSIKRPVVASVMSMILVIFGLVTFQEIPTDELPDVQPPVVTIQTDYKGASAEIVDTQITQKNSRRNYVKAADNCRAKDDLRRNLHTFCPTPD